MEKQESVQIARLEEHVKGLSSAVSDIKDDIKGLRGETKADTAKIMDKLEGFSQLRNRLDTIYDMVVVDRDSIEKLQIEEKINTEFRLSMQILQAYWKPIFVGVLIMTVGSLAGIVMTIIELIGYVK